MSKGSRVRQASHSSLIAWQMRLTGERLRGDSSSSAPAKGRLDVARSTPSKISRYPGQPPREARFI